jgi:hypothetical protein
MKSFKQHIFEKLKIASTHNIPSADEFIKTFDKYITASESFEFYLSMLDSIGKVRAADPNSIVKLPEYKITSDESFFDLPANKFFKYPEDTIYIYYIELLLDGKQYLFRINYIPKEGLNRDNMMKDRRYFEVYPEDLVNVLGEDIYKETYNYLEHYEKN